MIAAALQTDTAAFMGRLALMLGGARICGALLRWLGQPAVLGELLAGVLLGTSALGIVDPTQDALHILAELGVIMLLFNIGLETDMRSLMSVGAASFVVALIGVILPFALGFAVCRLMHLPSLAAVVAGAALTATSVGITARVLSDLNRLSDIESQVILGAAVIDDIIGLIILAIVAQLTQGQPVTASGVSLIAAKAFGFLAATLFLGRIAIPRIARWSTRTHMPGISTTFSLVLVLALAWLAAVAGSAMIIGAFAAGVLLRDSPQSQEIKHGAAYLGHFFVPLFFIAVGAEVDVSILNPASPAARHTLLIAAALVLVAILGKFLAGYAPFWFRGNKRAIGFGMIPRGEVGLIFAQMGLSSGVFDRSLFSAVTLVVMITTFAAPPLLKSAFPPRPSPRRPAHPARLPSAEDQILDT